MNIVQPEIDLIEMRRELDELRAKFAKLENGHDCEAYLESNVLAVTDRRGMMKKMAGLAVGVAAVGVLRPGTARAINKAMPDATGGPVVLGTSGNSASTSIVTGIINPGTILAPIVFAGSNYATGGAFTPPANTNVGVGGYSSAVGSTTPNHDVVGVYGIAATSGTGTATGVVGDGSDVGVSGTGARAALYLLVGSGAVADPNATVPSGALTGDVYRGSVNGSLWYNAGGTSPYRRLADGTTAGALTGFAASSRFINLSPLAAGATAAYQIGNVTAGANHVPTKARAIIGRIADANPTGGGGSILVSATNPPPAGTGVLVVTAGAPQNSFFFSSLDATGKLYVKNTSPSGSVEIIIDVAGYYE